VPRLILLNGPPAVGKSTLAQRYADEHPLALNLDMDHIRGLLGCWHDNPPRAGLLARKIALAAAGVHLAGGHDVVVPQLVARLAFIEQVGVAARDSAARFCEVFLLGDRASLQARYRQRPESRELPPAVTRPYRLTEPTPSWRRPTTSCWPALALKIVHECDVAMPMAIPTSHS